MSHLNPDAKKMTVLNFPRPLTTVDIVILTIMDDTLNVLLLKRPKTKEEPFPGKWALPGGFVDIDQDETLYDCALRKLTDKTGVACPYLEQVGSWGSATRDPRGWSATHVYVALLPNTPLKKTDQTSWIPVDTHEIISHLAFDHTLLLNAALDRIRSKTEYTSIPAYLLPETFTLSELQKVYEIVLGRKLEKKSFRTRMLAATLLEETGKYKKTSRRPALLYRLKKSDDLVYFSRNFEHAAK